MFKFNLNQKDFRSTNISNSLLLCNSFCKEEGPTRNNSFVSSYLL